ncbi:hypothetical protein LTR37_014029 [Vermiconidia calcicola]|uniref:Uncharacterized protein n=1 Tax=Vermiconidia calcicola TaxID=1690605 RepID=A0ACC3MV43_9PEZI|nr:hypothetical protein LTR37_014029 [Vermiconidia calcicola]
MFLSAGHGLPFVRPGEDDLSAQLLPLLAVEETVNPAVLTTEKPIIIDLTEEDDTNATQPHESAPRASRRCVSIDLTAEDEVDATQPDGFAPKASSRRVSRDSAVSLPRGRKQKAESSASPPKEQRRLSAHQVSASPKPKKRSVSQRLRQDIVERLNPASKDAIAQLHGLGSFLEEQIAGIVNFAQDVLRGQRDSTSLIDRLPVMEGAWIADHDEKLHEMIVFLGRHGVVPIGAVQALTEDEYALVSGIDVEAAKSEVASEAITESNDCALADAL